MGLCSPTKAAVAPHLLAGRVGLHRRTVEGRGPVALMRLGFVESNWGTPARDGRGTAIRAVELTSQWRSSETAHLRQRRALLEPEGSAADQNEGA